MHALCANYQAAIWRRCLLCEPDVPSPQGHGWKVDDEDRLIIEWMRGSPAPEAVLQFLSCKCKRSCQMPSCTCLCNGLRCTDMCKLQTCTNQAKEEDKPVELTDSDTDDEADE